MRLRAALRLSAEKSAHSMNEESTYQNPEEVIQTERALKQLKKDLEEDHSMSLIEPRRSTLKLKGAFLDLSYLTQQGRGVLKIFSRKKISMIKAMRLSLLE